MSRLSDATATIWAKSPNEQSQWLPLAQHLDDTAGVMLGLVESWVPRGAFEAAAAGSGLTVPDLRRCAQFLAGVHDIGKATPPFAVLNEALAEQMQAQGLFCEKGQVADLRGRAHHTRTGFVIVRDWLVERGVPRAGADTWAAVVGGHHGSPVGVEELADLDPEEVPHAYGAGAWESARRELLEEHWQQSGLVASAVLPLSQPTQAFLMGLVIVADWIASNEELFPYATSQIDRVACGLGALKLPAPWRAESTPVDAARLLTARFDLPVGAAPRPVQLDAVKAAWQLESPGLMIVEAPMGEGKTEAALAVAEVYAHRFGYGGLFFALPTQATTDAMFSRVMSWMEHLPGEDLPVGASVTLAHGKSRLNTLYDGLVRNGQGREVDADSHKESPGSRAMVHSWMVGRKKSGLASIVIGTIDQVLFAALKSKHLALRWLGLMGKVVVIDEVHAYDVWMSSYLDMVLRWLGAAKVPVVILSATLPPARRASLAKAYGGDEPALARGYPLITTVSGGVVKTHRVPASGRSFVVRLHELDNFDAALSATLQSALTDGGCALVVRNTVAMAQATADSLRGTFGAEMVTLHHARFLAVDRARRDEELLDRFGSPERLAERGSVRPSRHIVVATQVVEQSLDVDFDLLVTDIAPVDLVLQRLGRVHRHPRPRPAQVAQPTCYVTGVEWSEGVPAFPKSDLVYEQAALLDSLAVLRSRFGGSLVIPDDIAPLVAAAYDDDLELPGEWHQVASEARLRRCDHEGRQQRAAADFQIRPPRTGAIRDWIEGGVGDGEASRKARAAVRDIAETLECLVVVEREDGSWSTPDWLPDGMGNLAVPRDEAPSGVSARALAGCTVRLPQGRDLNNQEVEDALWEFTPESWLESAALYGWPVLPFARDPSKGCSYVASLHDTLSLRYSPETGLQVERS